MSLLKLTAAGVGVLAAGDFAGVPGEFGVTAAGDLAGVPGVAPGWAIVTIAPGLPGVPTRVDENGWFEEGASRLGDRGVWGTRVPLLGVGLEPPQAANNSITIRRKHVVMIRGTLELDIS